MRRITRVSRGRLAVYEIAARMSPTAARGNVFSSTPPPYALYASASQLAAEISQKLGRAVTRSSMPARFCRTNSPDKLVCRN